MSFKPAKLTKRASTSTLSVVWNYFDLEEDKGRVICKLCKQELCYNRNTSAMREHLKRKHVHVNLDEEPKKDCARFVHLLMYESSRANSDITISHKNESRFQSF